MPLPGGRLDDVIHPQDHFGGLGCAQQRRVLDFEGLIDATVSHVTQTTGQDVNSHASALGVRSVRSTQPADDIGRIKS